MTFRAERKTPSCHGGRPEGPQADSDSTEGSKGELPWLLMRANYLAPRLNCCDFRCSKMCVSEEAGQSSYLTLSYGPLRVQKAVMSICELPWTFHNHRQSNWTHSKASRDNSWLLEGHNRESPVISACPRALPDCLVLGRTQATLGPTSVQNVVTFLSPVHITDVLLLSLWFLIK